MKNLFYNIIFFSTFFCNQLFSDSKIVDTNLFLVDNLPKKEDYRFSTALDNWYIKNANGKSGYLPGITFHIISENSTDNIIVDDLLFSYYQGNVTYTHSNNNVVSEKKYFYAQYNKKYNNRKHYMAIGVHILFEKNHETAPVDWLYDKSGTNELYENYRIFTPYIGHGYRIDITNKLSFRLEVRVNFSYMSIDYPNAQTGVNKREIHKSIGLGAMEAIQYDFNKKWYLQFGFKYDVYDISSIFSDSSNHYDDVGLNLKIGYIF